MRRPRWAAAVVAMALATLAILGGPAAVSGAPGAAGDGTCPGWLGEEMPLPLAVRAPRDLAVKALAERQYLIFNLLAGGKHAFDAGRFGVAANKWEALLRLPGLDPEIERLIRPLATDARARVGGQAQVPTAAPPAGALSVSPASATPSVAAGEPPPGPAPAPAARVTAPGVTVAGTVSGGGALGPGGTVLWLKRADGQPTPRPAPAHGKVVSQRNKTFTPHVLAVPVGTKVDFRNEDDLFHNVFSLSRPNDFDTGLYRQGGSYAQTFRKAGVVQILCNIHSSMLGYVFVVDTPYYTQADAAGAFIIKNVPPGDYELETWHEASAKPWKQKITVGGEGLRGVAVKVAGDKASPAYIPDKSGKPRQAHLGY